MALWAVFTVNYQQVNTSVPVIFLKTHCFTPSITQRNVGTVEKGEGEPLVFWSATDTYGWRRENLRMATVSAAEMLCNSERPVHACLV